MQLGLFDSDSIYITKRGIRADAKKQVERSPKKELSYLQLEEIKKLKRLCYFTTMLACSGSLKGSNIKKQKEEYFLKAEIYNLFEIFPDAKYVLDVRKGMNW